MSETVAEVILGVFGENPALNIAFWSSSILIAVTVYAFFFKETTAAYQKYYDYKLEKSAEAAMVAAQIANVQDVKVLRKALARFDELYYGHLILFESRDLAGQMVEFRKLFVKKDEDLTAAKVMKKRKANGAAVRQAALRLASVCRREVRPTLLHLIYDRLFPIPQ